MVSNLEQIVRETEKKNDTARSYLLQESQNRLSKHPDMRSGYEHQLLSLGYTVNAAISMKLDSRELR